MPHRTDWFRDAGWGVFTHYLAETVAHGANTTVSEWNDLVDHFDVTGLANQLVLIGAKYYFITLGQNSGFYCAPNETYDHHVGIQPGQCSTRDLISDLYEALHPKGITLLVYLPSGAPDKDPVAMERLEWKPGQYPSWRVPHDTGGLDEQGRPWGAGDPRFAAFQRKWENVIREWSLCWGSKIAGWWFDGCYYAYAMYEFPDPPNFASFAAAARAGNPDSILAFNPGVVPSLPTITEHQDYTAGEISTTFPTPFPRRFVNQAQYHILSYLGENWGRGPTRFPDEFVIDYTRRVIENQWVITWDVPIQPGGLIERPFIEQLCALRQGLS